MKNQPLQVGGAGAVTLSLPGLSASSCVKPCLRSARGPNTYSGALSTLGKVTFVRFDTSVQSPNSSTTRQSISSASVYLWKRCGAAKDCLQVERGGTQRSDIRSTLEDRPGLETPWATYEFWLPKAVCSDKGFISKQHFSAHYVISNLPTGSNSFPQEPVLHSNLFRIPAMLIFSNPFGTHSCTIRVTT
jgi:hypothetical protein